MTEEALELQVAARLSPFTESLAAVLPTSVLMLLKPLGVIEVDVPLKPSLVPSAVSTIA